MENSTQINYNREVGILTPSRKLDQIYVTRYMGTKLNLLNFIIPKILKEVETGDTIFDIMAGTQSIGYSLKYNNRIFSNDIQEYSYYIGKALIENNSANISKISAITELKNNYIQNIQNKKFNLFSKTYSDTYFSAMQCDEIDSIRFAIEKIDDEYKKALYLTCLMYAMGYAQSTTGHFAQYLPPTHGRVIPLRKINIWNVFLDKCDNIKVKFSKFENKCFNNDYKDFFRMPELENFLKQAKLVYVDPPYTAEQYSRFYHILETLVKYDYPEVMAKGKYRKDRYFSGFSQSSKVKDEFQVMIKNFSTYKVKLAISYSNKGLIPITDITNICHNYYGNVSLSTFNYKHSTQGKGNLKVKEFLIICK